MRSLVAFLAAPGRLALGGREFQCGEIKIRGLAALEAWAVSGWTDPMDELRPRLALMTVEERQDAAFAVIDDLESGPPLYGTRAFEDLLATPEGMVEFSCAALLPYNPDATETDVVAAHVDSAPEEWGRLWRVAWGSDSLAEANRILDGPNPNPPRPIEWARLFAAVCKVAPMTPAQFGDLTFSQAVMIASGGKPAEPGPAFLPGESVTDAAKRRRALYLRSLERRRRDAAATPPPEPAPS